MSNEQLPTDGEYRGVPLHAGQTEARLAVVRADVDKVHALADLEDLVDLAKDVGRAPEARVFARMKCLALLDDAVDRRAPRSRNAALDRQYINALARGLTCRNWQNPWNYCSLLDPGSRRGAIGPVPREVPLPDKWTRTKTE